MENKPLVIALSLFGIGLLAAAMVGVVYVTKLEEIQRRPGQLGADWSTLGRFEGRQVTTGGVAFTVDKVLYGEQVNPVIREPVRAECQEAIVLKIKARNVSSSPVTLTPGVFSLVAKDKNGVRQSFSQGFDAPVLPTGAERTYFVGFKALTTVLPCTLKIEGDTLRSGAPPELASFTGVIDVCPSTF